MRLREASVNLSDERLFSPQNIGYVKRGVPEQLKLIFGKYASRLVDGEPFMTEVDFLVRYLGIFPEQEYNKHSAHLLR